MNDKGKPQLVIFWTTLVVKDKKDFSYKTFVEMFVHLAMSLLSGTIEPRISKDIKRIMQLFDQAKTGDWYLYQNFIEIRVYGY